MPQMKAKKKIFRARISENSQNNVPAILQSFTLTEFQQLQKNITGGAE